VSMFIAQFLVMVIPDIPYQGGPQTIHTTWLAFVFMRT